jgi:hypothetical protein
MSTYPSSKKPKPLLVLKKPIAAKVYTAKFRPFESTKYLNVKALKAVKSAKLEVGAIEFAGESRTVAAEIKYGKVVGLQPLDCKACDDKKGKPVKAPAMKKASAQIAAALLKGGVKPPHFPAPVTVSKKLGFQIPIGPIIIVIFDDDIIFDLCIEIWIGNRLCTYCLFQPSTCIDFGPPEL